MQTRCCRTSHGFDIATAIAGTVIVGASGATAPTTMMTDIHTRQVSSSSLAAADAITTIMATITTVRLPVGASPGPWYANCRPTVRRPYPTLC